MTVVRLEPVSRHSGLGAAEPLARAYGECDGGGECESETGTEPRGLRRCPSGKAFRGVIRARDQGRRREGASAEQAMSVTVHVVL